jgi:hypothetical protein
MSVYLKPCTGCPIREGCEQRDEFRRRVKGLGLRSATFNCERLKKALQPGTRVVISHPITVASGGDHYYGPEFEIVREDLPATIVSADSDEFSCVIDRDALVKAIEGQEGEGADKVDTYRFRKTMKARRIVRFLNEPRRSLCDCGKVRLTDGTCDKRPTEDCFSLTSTNRETEAA